MAVKQKVQLHVFLHSSHNLFPIAYDQSAILQTPLLTFSTTVFIVVKLNHSKDKFSK